MSWSIKCERNRDKQNTPPTLSANITNQYFGSTVDSKSINVMYTGHPIMNKIINHPRQQQKSFNKKHIFQNITPSNYRKKTMAKKIKLSIPVCVN